MAYVNPNVESMLADICGGDLIMDETAEKVAGLVRSYAAPHTDAVVDAEDPRQFIDTIKVTKAAGGKDRVVYSDDPLAFIKEYPHKVVVHGEVVGMTKGTHAFKRAIDAMPGS